MRSRGAHVPGDQTRLQHRTLKFHGDFKMKYMQKRGAFTMSSRICKVLISLDRMLCPSSNMKF
jgi:hypothetical protein